MNLSLVATRPKHSFLAVCFGLIAGACLTPPGAKTATDASDPGKSEAVATAAPQNPRDFTHTSAELLAELGIGWNLGNSLDAPDGETGWGNPVVTPELLTAVAKAGFKIVRIPVTWTKHTGAGPEYEIDAGWLKRVEEVVGYAHSAGLYSIINVHHDGADGFKEVEWLTLNDDQGETTKENNATVTARFVAVWEQIAEHFAGHGEELLFESMNEIHDGYGNPDPRHISFINDLNQEFVKLVRASGSNNDKRHLVLPGYNTNIEHTVKGFKLPSDSLENKLILSAHFYDPYLFALQAEKNTWGKASPGAEDWGQEDHVVKEFDRLKSTFIDKGVPVILGEYGATHQDGFEDYRRYYMEYVTKAAVDRGIVPIYWDNGGQGSGGDKFGLFGRSSNTVLHPAILEAMIRAATKDYKLSDIALPKPSE